MPKTALITGVTGQDGSYLIEFLLEKGYEVHGLVRRTSLFNRGRIDGVRDKASDKGQVFQLHYGDLADSSSINSILSRVRPDELYNLAAQSHVKISFDKPEYTTDVDGIGVLRLLEGLRINRLETRFYQASTSELYGKAVESPQNEQTPFYPRSPYSIAKLYGFWIVIHYREAYGMHASNGILFNHESPRRGENFVTRKITLSLAKIKYGLQKTLRLGNLDAKRDWGYARDYVEMMWKMLQQDQPDDYVVATGETHSVREFIEKAAAIAGFDLEWEGKDENEKGRDKKTGNIIVEVEPKFFRLTEVDALCGDISKAREKLGWNPRVKFDELVEIMMKADLERASSNAKASK
jgi:GDPmannose 4,6-dehydratase